MSHPFDLDPTGFVPDALKPLYLEIRSAEDKALAMASLGSAKEPIDALVKRVLGIFIPLPSFEITSWKPDKRELKVKMKGETGVIPFNA